MTTDWLLRVGDGENFKHSSKCRIWGVVSKYRAGKHFIENIKPGDRLWFVKNKSLGKLIAVATYRSHNKREFGPLIDISLTNKELGWSVPSSGNINIENIDIEVHYTDLYGLADCELLTHIKGPSTIRKYDEKCRVNLAVEYSYIVRYSRVTFKL
jgi:hypothetical protein